MREIIEKIVWRRRGVARDYVGSLVAGSDGIRLAGRDPRSRLDVTLAIPLDEVDGVDFEDDRWVVLDLADSDPILIRPDGDLPIHAQVLARRLGGLARPPALITQGGAR
jgi:hypothetical protein